MGSIVFFGTDDRKTREYLAIWLELADGSLPLSEIKRLYQERFGCELAHAADAKTIALLTASGSTAYGFKNGVVSMPQVH
jgi:hypothetical protein